MHEHAPELAALLWFTGWFLAVAVLFAAGLQLPLATRLSGAWTRLYAVGCVAAGIGVWVLSNVAIVLNDTHIDLTREKIYTPSADALAVVDELQTPVRITYFYRSDDPVGRRTADILGVMGRRNSLLSVVAVDPDKRPELARREGIRLYNAAVIEAGTRRVLIQGTDEAQIAIGIQRVLCTRLIAANPRTTFLPAESTALRSYLTAGGSALLLFDLGFVPEPGLAQLLSDLGVRLEQQVVIDPLSHYQSDPEMVAVTGYEQHPITRTISLTFFPGIRPLALTQPASGVVTTPILRSSRDSYARPVQPASTRTIESASASEATDLPRPLAADTSVPQVRPRVLGIAAEGTLAPGAPPLRAVVFGDGDFASNSFLPYMANSDLALAAVRWLAREEQGTVVRTRIPVPPMILLTAAQSRAIFALIVILLPLAVVGIGAVVWW